MQITSGSLDLALHGVFTTAIGAAVYYLRHISRLLTMLRDFPPHRHEPGGNIAYPYDYRPTPLGKLNGEAKY